MDDIRNRIKRHVRPTYGTTRKSGVASSGTPDRARKLIGALGKSAVRHPQKYTYIIRAYFVKTLRHSHWHQVYAGLSALLLIISLIGTVLQPFIENKPYKLAPLAREVIARPNPTLAQYFTDGKDNLLEYNKSFAPMTKGDLSAKSDGTPRLKASFDKAKDAAMTVTDPYSESAVTLTPKFSTGLGKQDQNQIVYRLGDLNGYMVYTSRISGVKEDVLLNEYDKDELVLKYSITMPESIEARLEIDGSIGFYGSDLPINGQVSTGGDKDAELLEKARKNSSKTKLLFTIPRPVAVETNKKVSSLGLQFSLTGNDLSLKVNGLKKANYPLSIDPSVYVETAKKLMQGNNESNIDFDVSNELIQKSQTTGARIESWTDTTDMNTDVWDQSTTAAAGYVYRAGGRTGRIMPRIIGSKTSARSTDGTTFTMDMPAVRPAGDLYVALMCHDGSGTNVVPPGGWTEYADLREHAAYYKVGTDQGGGNESATYAWTGASEEWAGVILRISNFDPADIVSGTAGTGSNGSAAIPIYPTTTPDKQGSLVLRASGFNNDVPPAINWSPITDHSGVIAGNSGGANDCGFTSDILDSPPLSTVATGTATLNSTAGISDTYGASTIAINGITATPAVQSTVQWAQFNTTTNAIESPNPGNGVCSGWCNNSAYNLPEGRVGMSFVSYNGFLYAIGGSSDGANANNKNTVWISKLGANGEPSLWHPTGGTPTYWYASTNTLTTALAYGSTVAYNNRLYLLGGRNTSGTSLSDVRVADLLPNGDIGTWSTTGMQTLPDVRHGHSVHIYNDTMYLIGGNSGGTLRNTVYYSKINNSGTMNTWTATSSFATARTSLGGVMSGVWGGYVYLAGGCTAVNGTGTGYCTTIGQDVQIASINADGTLSEWNTVLGLRNQRFGYTFIAWQNGLYRFGGCSRQDTTTGDCYASHIATQYGVVNQDGDASTVSSSDPDGSGTCVTPNWYNCDLPPAGEGAGQGGQMSSVVVINNGFLYVIGGCHNTVSGSECYSALFGAQMSGNTSYGALSSTGTIVRAASCTGTWVGAWCVDSTDPLNGAAGLGAAGGAVFDNVVYIIGGTTGSDWQANVWRVGFNADGSLNGTWTSQTLNSLGLSGTADDERGYLYAFTRANPSAVATNPGNLYILGGCRGANVTDNSITCTNYYTEVIKCHINTSGVPNTCTTTNQLQIDSDDVNSGSQPLGLMAGAMYANRIYLVGGACAVVGSDPNAPCGSNYAANRRDTIYARIDDSNNIVADGGSIWKIATGKMSPQRQRGSSFGYNGYIYSLAGYNSAGTLNDLLFAKIDVSTGDFGDFNSSGVVVTQRWDLRAIVSNGYVYAIGGCAVGAPGACDDFQWEIQTFQLYNNNSGAPVSFTSASDDTFAADTDRWGASATVLNGYIYVAGGCISATDCTNATNNVQYAPISTVDGSVGTWASATNVLPGDRTWGQLETAGGSLYYLGGQDDTATNEQSTIYYASTFSSGNITGAWSTASGGIGDTASQVAQERTKFSSSVWNNRIYVVGGLNVSATATNTVYISPQLNSGGNIVADSWTSDTDTLNVARSGNMVVAYANNLYSFGGHDGTYYLGDSQFAKINPTDGTISTWSYTTSLPSHLQQGEAFASNGYMYILGGRSATATCLPNTIVAPISANTTIASGNNPTGVGEWYETNQKYTGDRYGAAVTYSNGKAFVLGGGCSAPLATTRHYYATLKSQPQIAKYSRMIDTDTDVFPTKWLMNGLDNSIGAKWNMRYRSMTDIDGDATDCVTAMTAWGQETNFGVVTLGNPATYTPLDGSGTNTNCARYFYFSVSIDSSQAFGYPEDVTRGPTIADLSLFFTADPSKRLIHGKTFTGGLQQPLDTPF